MLAEFIKCPVCAGHEAIGADTATTLEAIIEATLSLDEHSQQVETELWNMLNALRNARERKPTIDPLLI